ncbi:MAG: OmpH family outer membrane protein [Sphingomonas sp.]|nr:OmpH family outer membrane protein [Sphingomonas sp.]
MRKIAMSAAFAAMVVAPTGSFAQTIPGAVVAVVDLEKVSSDCTACKSAKAALEGQVNALKSREAALAAPLKTEGEALQKAVQALNGKEPDAALQARIKAFQTKQQSGAQEIARQTNQIQRNQAYVSQQISTKLGPIYQQVMQRRGANIMVEAGATLAAGSSLDVTNDVLSALNQQLPSVATTAPAAPQQQPQGR